MRRIYLKSRSFTFLPAFAVALVPGLDAPEPFPRDEKADALEKARAAFEVHATSIPSSDPGPPHAAEHDVFP